MRYIFIFNGLPDRKWVIDEVSRQIDEAGLVCQKYVTTDPGDATRFVNVFCDLNPKEEVCFVACGGAGLTNEVLTGIVGKENKHLAILSYGGTNDFTKYFPELDFQNLSKLLGGERRDVDVIKIDDNYSLNVSNLGMDAMVTLLGQMYISMNQDQPYAKAVKKSLLKYRLNPVTIYADGERLNFKWFTSAQIANGKYSGGEYLCAPRALIDDGYIELSIFRPMSLTSLILVIPKFQKGLHLEDKLCKKYIKYRRCKHIELKSKMVIPIAVDGEVIFLENPVIDILHKAVSIILPSK